MTPRTRSRLRNDLYCVEWGVKLYSLTPGRDSVTLARTLRGCSQPPTVPDTHSAELDTEHIDATTDPWANDISLTSCTRMTQPSLLIHLPRHPPVSVVSARLRQCSVCVFHGQRLKFKTSALDHSHRLFWSTEINLHISGKSTVI